MKLNQPQLVADLGEPYIAEGNSRSIYPSRLHFDIGIHV